MDTVLEMLAATAGRVPERVAFSDPEKSVTWGELLATAQKIGLRLSGIAQFGSGVAFYLEKSVDSVKAMFGAVFAGCFYSYIDVRQPEERLCKMLQKLCPSVVITDKTNAAALRRAFDSQNLTYSVILLEDLVETAESAAPISAVEIKKLDAIAASMADTMPLYVNFTSGSTGVPKGVAVSHGNVIGFIRHFLDVFPFSENDVFANQAPFDFDVSVKDIYSALSCGARVALIPRSMFSTPAVLMDYLAENSVTVMVWAVSALCMISGMGGLEYRVPKTVKRIMFSGEVMPIKHINKWSSFLPDCTFVNLYGPTETTCNCTYYVLDKREYALDEKVPIGKHFQNMKVFLLDESNCEISSAIADTAGEICVGGRNVAIGYYNDPEKTEKAFVQNPLQSCFYERVYRTGDLGYYGKDGNLYYLSRKDNQIKHMGQRIELTEIEAVVNGLNGVDRSCCLYQHDIARIVLFFTGTVQMHDLRAEIKTKLPTYMIPGKIIEIESFPLNKNGKIDRKKLKEMIV